MQTAKNQIQILYFENHKIDSIEIDGKKYISSGNMAAALEYSSSKSITNLFNANKGEFTEGEDYTVIDMMTVKNAPYKQIFFSIEGVIGITMLAKTPKAVEFRKWARKVLINLPQSPQLPQNYVQALECLVIAEKEKLELRNIVKEKDNIIQVKDTQIENATKLFKQIADKTGCVKFQPCARHLGITDTVLRTLLIKNGWRRKDKHFPTTDGVNKGYVKLLPEEFDVKFKDGNTQKKSSLAFYITEKGYNQILEQVSGIILN